MGTGYVDLQSVQGLYRATRPEGGTDGTAGGATDAQHARRAAMRNNAANVATLPADTRAAVRSKLIQGGFLGKSQGLLNAAPPSSTRINRYGG